MHRDRVDFSNSQGEVLIFNAVQCMGTIFHACSLLNTTKYFPYKDFVQPATAAATPSWLLGSRNLQIVANLPAQEIVNLAVPAPKGIYSPSDSRIENLLGSNSVVLQAISRSCPVTNA